MVDVFRNQSAFLAQEAIAIGAKSSFTGINEQAASPSREAGLNVVMDRCPAIELQRGD